MSCRPCCGTSRKHLDKKKTALDVSGWTMESPTTSVPQQRNGCDCGVFMCTYANFLVAGHELLGFSQQDMPLFRARLAADVLRGYVAVY